MASKKRAFISFDYDNDSYAKIMLAGQAKLPDSPFDFTDASIKERVVSTFQIVENDVMERLSEKLADMSATGFSACWHSVSSGKS